LAGPLAELDLIVIMATSTHVSLKSCCVKHPWKIHTMIPLEIAAPRHNPMSVTYIIRMLFDGVSLFEVRRFYLAFIWESSMNHVNTFLGGGGTQMFTCDHMGRGGGRGVTGIFTWTLNIARFSLIEQLPNLGRLTRKSQFWLDLTFIKS